MPVALAGAVIAASGWSDDLRDVRIIGWTMIVFGVVRWWVHRTATEERVGEA